MIVRPLVRVLLVSCAVSLAGAQPSPAQPSSAQPSPAQPSAPAPSLPAAFDWPVVTQTARPWTRWWWQGSAVTPTELTAAMEAYRDAGLGGLELTPIYGVRGTEQAFVPYLSPAWMSLLDHTMREASRLGLGLDMATGTGWPFGGPWVSQDEACRTLVVRTFSVAAGQRLAEPVAATQEPFVRAVGQVVYELTGSILGPPKDDGKPQAEARPAQATGRPVTIEDLVDPTSANRNLQSLALDQVRFPRALPLVALVASSEDGETLDLASRVGPGGVVDWVAPPGTWTVRALFLGWHGKQVERAAPGGEGDVIDHFSRDAVTKYLSAFDRAFAGHDVSSIRAFFNDSYEVDDARGQADWTARLFDEFQARRGYDLRRHLPALFGEGPAETGARVLTDYRETISDLVLEGFTTTWRTWAARRGAIVRNQSHGAPANLLDLYAASDIPETEGTDLLRIKSASSAAHVSGKALASAEAATWLKDHFLSSLGDVRRALDRYFIGGVNHVVYHGTAYSPRAAAWPGWLFYAAVHFQPASPLWRDFRALNDYVTRVQGFLQEGEADNDVLLYFPFHDSLAVRGKALLEHFDGGGAVMTGTPFRSRAEWLQERGYAFDYVSDRQVATLRATPDGLRAGDTRYKAIVVPATRTMPHETMERLVALARGGATIVFAGALPADVPGLGRLDERRAALARETSVLAWTEAGGVRESRVGGGQVSSGERLDVLLARAGVDREPMVDRGLQFTRRRTASGVTYFLVNGGDTAIDGWVPLARGAGDVVVFDPMQARRGLARRRVAEDGRHEVYLQLAPGASCVLRVLGGVVGGSLADARESGATFPVYRAAGEAVPIADGWRIEFVSGGPALPPATTLAALGSWTALGGEAVRAFSGTARYTVRVPRPAAGAAAWRLDLGRVHESARVSVNGEVIGTLIGPDYSVVIDGARFAETNVIEVEVSNLMANRIADMDRRGVPWKIFYNVNMPASLAENRAASGLFDASTWEPRPSGLLGPVTLTPLARVH